MANFDPPLPADACDCHVHLFLPARFPYAADRAYTPPPATIDDLEALQARLGAMRCVLVQPSCYGDDDGALLAGLAHFGARACGVTVADPAVLSDDDVARLHAAGVRGLRFNLSVQGFDADTLARDLDAMERRMARLGWHAQIHAGASLLPRVAPLLAGRQLPIVLDHFGGGAASADVVARLLEGRRVWLKLSAPYRVSTRPDHDDLAAVVARHVEAAPDRLLWASDWPHTGGNGARAGLPTDIDPFRDVDDVASVDRLARWIPDPVALRRVLVDNPATLYGFADDTASSP